MHDEEMIHACEALNFPHLLLLIVDRTHIFVRPLYSSSFSSCCKVELYNSNAHREICHSVLLTRNLKLSFFCFLLILLPSRIRISVLYPCRINLKIWVLETVSRTPWTSDQPVTRPLPIQAK
jgi:hypothetical protein